MAAAASGARAIAGLLALWVGLTGCQTSGTGAQGRSSTEPSRSPGEIRLSDITFDCDRGAIPVYALPGLKRLSGSGLNELARIRDPDCKSARLIGRLPDENLNLSPEDAAKPFSGGWYLVALDDPPGVEGWVQLLRLDRTHYRSDAVAAAKLLPEVSPEPLADGTPDLVPIRDRPTYGVGDRCPDTRSAQYVGGKVYPLWVVHFENSGDGASPAFIDVAYTNDDGTTETLSIALIRGLEPGERSEFTSSTGEARSNFAGGTTIAIDPADKITEADEKNNVITLSQLGPLVCKG